MSRYGYFKYGGATYGLPPTLAYSVEPMSINVVGFNDVYLSWQTATGNFTRLRVVRNQNGFPETSEDGVIIYEVNSTDGSSIGGTSFRTDFYDGVDNPDQPAIIQGRNIFYTVFLYTSDKVWVKAGKIREIVPENTGVTTKAINLLPRTVSTSELSPFGTIDPETSDLYKFLDGLSFTYEQLLTEIKLSRKSDLIGNSNYSTIPGEVYSLGLTIEPSLPTSRQRSLIREAIALYAAKGTKQGVENYAELLTGFAPTVTVSANLLLSSEDSTFYNGIGNWVSSVDTIEAITDGAIGPSTLSTPYVIDDSYMCKIHGTGAHEMTLGLDSPITKGVPVSPETDYVFYSEVKCPTTGTIAAKIEYYDKDGTVVDNDTASISATSTWKALTFTTTSPAGAAYAVLYISWDSAKTYYLDRVMVAVASTEEYEEARATTILLNPKMENYIENPSFEVDASNWTVSDATFSTNTDVPLAGYAGTNSGKFVASDTWTLECNSSLELEPGIYFNVSQYVKSDDITSFTGYIDLYDSTDTVVDTVEQELTVTADWERVHMTALVDVGSTAAYAKYRISAPAGTLYLDMVMAQDSYDPTDYFDGSMPAQVGALWRGTANASGSMLYPNKEIKLSRLAETINEWVPMNSWWRITTPAGLEYNVLDV